MPTFNSCPVSAVSQPCTCICSSPSLSSSQYLSHWLQQLSTLVSPLACWMTQFFFWFSPLSQHLSWDLFGQYPFGLKGSKDTSSQTLPFEWLFSKVFSGLSARTHWVGECLWPETSQEYQSERDQWWQQSHGMWQREYYLPLESWSFLDYVHETVCDSLKYNVYTQEGKWIWRFILKN